MAQGLEEDGLQGALQTPRGNRGGLECSRTGGFSGLPVGPGVPRTGCAPLIRWRFPKGRGYLSIHTVVSWV